MNPNFFENLQALSTLFNLTRQAQIQNSLRDASLLSLTAPSRNPVLSQIGSSISCQMPLPSFDGLNSLEMSKQNTILSHIYQNNIQHELKKAQILANQAEARRAQEIMSPLGVLISKEIDTNTHRSKNMLPSLIYNNKMTQEFLVKSMLDYFVQNFGLVSQSEIEKEKQKYSHDEVLTEVFNTLIVKYSSMTKTKEEMIKYVFRKALKSIKDKLKGTIKKSDKDVTKVFFQKYFSLSKDDMTIKNGFDLENEEELTKFMLPFKKDSANKTMNSNFMANIFASEEFCAAYEEYLWEFEREADYDNVQKINKSVSFIMSCIKSNKISLISNNKRVPWLKMWVSNAKRIGYQLMCEKSSRKVRKMVKLEKVEFNASNCLETSDSECKAEVGTTPEST